jgi:D-alanyl-D-alanine carboxypeptidase
VFSLNILKSRAGLFLGGFVLFVLIAVSIPSGARADAKYSSLVIDADTGVILHDENAGEYRYPASLVKMMTLYMAFQSLESGKLSMNQQLTASAHAAGQAPSSLRLKAGQSITVNEAILGVVIKSANDAAVVLGEAMGGNEKNFASMMNVTAKKLGMDHTNFENASGLPDLKQKTTAYDLARLAVALRRDYPKYYPLFEKTEFVFNKQVFFSHNRVTKNYRGADGLKTGYIRASGFNLVTSAKRNGRSLVGVVMGGQTIKGRDRNMIKLLDNAFYQSSKGNQKNTASIDVLPAGGSKRASGIPVPELKPRSQASLESVPTPEPKPGINDPEGAVDEFSVIEDEKGDAYIPALREVEQGGEN